MEKGGRGGRDGGGRGARWGSRMERVREGGQVSTFTKRVLRTFFVQQKEKKNFGAAAIPALLFRVRRLVTTPGRSLTKFRPN